MKKSKASEQLKKGFYIRIPKAVMQRKEYSLTMLYVYGALLSYAINNRHQGLNLKTRDFAAKIGLTLRVVQYCIQALASNFAYSIRGDKVNRNKWIDEPLIRIYQKGRKRMVHVNVTDADAFVLIPTQMVKDTALSVPYKMAYGQAFATRNNYTYESIKDIADYLGKHKASAYRYIKELQSKGYISRDASSAGYRYVPLDSYSTETRSKQSKSKEKVHSVGERATEGLANAPPLAKADSKEQHALKELGKTFNIPMYGVK